MNVENKEKIGENGSLVIKGDCLDLIKEISSDTVDTVFTDPPYPNIKRAYGKWTVDEWRDLIDNLIVEIRRVLTPNGSAVFILQHQCSPMGHMDGWLWRFLADYSEQWNIVQDVYWWNYNQMPTATAQRKLGLLRGSVKYCVWMGPKDCYRDQDKVLWEPADSTLAKMKAKKCNNKCVYMPSGMSVNKKRVFDTIEKRGGTTPFNLLPMSNGGSAKNTAGGHKHPAGTPPKLTHWWLRYITPSNGIVLDPFYGSGTTGIVAHELGLQVIGFERYEEYYNLAKKRTDDLYNNERSLFDSW